MSEFARVESVEALKDLRVALCRFAEGVKLGIEESEGQISRTVGWLARDQRPFWKRQLERRRENLARAKLDLMSKQNLQTALDHKPSFVDEKKALARARLAVEEAERKAAAVQHWMRVIEQEAFTFKGAVQGLLHHVEVDIPNALARLDRMIAALEGYAASTPAEAWRMAAPPVVAAGPRCPDLHILRAQTPARERRDDPRLEAVGGPWPAAELAASSVAAVAGLNLGAWPCAPDDRVVVARECGYGDALYLERIHPAAGDSGWYVGVVGGSPAEGYQVLTVAALLERRPQWAVLLNLPPGTLVVLRGGTIERVADGGDRPLWSAEPSPVDAETDG